MPASKRGPKAASIYFADWAWGDGRVGTGLRVGVAVGRGGGADILGRRLCSEALAISRAICSWLALNCSAALALSRVICSWLILSCSMLALSCSISCPAVARSRDLVPRGCEIARHRLEQLRPFRRRGRRD